MGYLPTPGHMRRPELRSTANFTDASAQNLKKKLFLYVYHPPALVLVQRETLLIHNTTHELHQWKVQGDFRRDSPPAVAPVGQVPTGGSPKCFQAPCTGGHRPDAVQRNGVACVDTVRANKTST